MATPLRESRKGMQHRRGGPPLPIARFRERDHRAVALSRWARSALTDAQRRAGSCGSSAGQAEPIPAPALRLGGSTGDRLLHDLKNVGRVASRESLK